MHLAQTITGMLACVSGFVSAYYWWISARIGPIDVPRNENPEAETGDMLFDYGGDKNIFLNYSKQSRLNARAAAWTAGSVLLQAATIILSLSGRSG